MMVAKKGGSSGGTAVAAPAEVAIEHGSVVIAAITSCTNTSNPSNMIAAALLAKKAAARGLNSKPWVKTSFAPGSKVVMEYLERADLYSSMEALGFQLVGFGCTTCNGSGYKGRVGLYETMEVTDELRELIIIGASAIELRRKAVELGMITLRGSGLCKLREGITTIEEVVKETVL